MFPTHVGMNRCCRSLSISAKDVPHTRGDEPKETGITDEAAACSPHTWG